MIISASRRTDIPAFYADWFVNRIRAGYCIVPNPFNPGQVSRVSLKPEDVDVIVFWTRNPRPLMRHLAELDARGYHYYFQYTLLDNPRPIDPHVPALEASLATFRELADRVGPERVIWRYDPIVWSNVTGTEFHQETYERIVRALRGRGGARRSVISLLDVYRKAEKRLKALARQGIELATPDEDDLGKLMRTLVEMATANDMEIASCAEQIDLRPYGVRPGKCVDDEYIKRVFGLDVTHEKDPSQRQACGCVVSRDIGMYDSCLFGCVYCYATSNLARARANHAQHHPDSPSLIGWHEASIARPCPASAGRLTANE
jgi:hypothetical protein